MELFGWCNDFRFVLLILALIYIIWMHFKYVSPIENSALDFKDAVRELSLKRVRPVIENKSQLLIKEYIKEANGMLSEYSVGRILKDIAKKLSVKVSDNITNDFEFEDMPKEE